MDKFNLLGGQNNLLGGQMPTQLTCYYLPESSTSTTRKTTNLGKTRQAKTRQDIIRKGIK